MLTTLIAYAAIGALQQQVPAISEAEKKQTIESLLDALDESYVFPELAKEAGAKIRRMLAAGDYKAVASPSAFASKLSSDVNNVLNDAHFRVRYSAERLPVRQNRRVRSPEEIEDTRRQTIQVNAGFEKAERLNGNIGYIEVRAFLDPELFAKPCAAVFDFLASTDSLIIDLRRNDGGHPRSVQILCSYLFGEEPVHLNSIYSRRTDSTTEYWTLQDLPGTRYPDKPVIVLTSRRTGSGAEECAYNIQTQKRATIVGEVTWGGANPGSTVRLNDHFSEFIPNGRAINPVTKTNWEGVGVQPDVKTSSDEALLRGQIIAVEKMIERADPARAMTLRHHLEMLKSGGAG